MRKIGNRFNAIAGDGTRDTTMTMKAKPELMMRNKNAMWMKKRSACSLYPT